ncbi:MAG: helix-turn-helix transcriptional regulator [Bacteroidia bacterium]
MEFIEQNKILKVFKLLRLLKEKPHRTAKQLAKTLEVCDRTVTRYIELLEELGYDIDKKVGTKAYFLAEYDDVPSPVADYPMKFTEEETIFILQLLKNTNLKADEINALMRKLNVHSELNNLPAQLESQKLAKITAQIAEAIAQKKQVKLKKYESNNTQTVEDRIVEPLGFLENEKQSFAAFEVKSGIVKHFKIGRMQSIKLLDKKRSYQGESLETDIFGMSSTETYPIELKLSQQAYHLLVEEYPAAIPHLKKLQESCYLLRADIKDFRGVGRFILGLPGEIEIVSPDTLREYVKERAGKALY